MKYLWFLPYEYIPPIATGLVMLSGLALMLQRKALFATLFVTAILLLCGPLLDPFIEELNGAGIDIGGAIFSQLPWWAKLLTAGMALLLMVRLVVGFLFNRQVADHVTGDLISSAIRALVLGRGRMIFWPAMMAGLATCAYQLHLGAPAEKAPVIAPAASLGVVRASESPIDWQDPPALAADHLGPLRVGMTYVEAEQALRGDLVRDRDFQQHMHCYYASPRTSGAGIRLMFSHDLLARFDVASPNYETELGVRVGTPESEALDTYGERLSITPHRFHRDGHSLAYTPRKLGSGTTRIVFETEGSQIVAMRAGKAPEVDSTHGCQ